MEDDKEEGGGSVAESSSRMNEATTERDIEEGCDSSIISPLGSAFPAANPFILVEADR
ncbi:hypothetical protein NQZ68_004744 [Dissostichus eleginoides]|nr:hypothetical protein NQZ68_004744 [Dissostichus eleginoides]